jgi:hypothetical protein
MVVGSFGWGFAADAFGTLVALLAAGVLLVLVAASVTVLPLLPGTRTVDRSTTTTWATPNLVFEPAAGDGPVLVEITYAVDTTSLAAFRSAMRQVEGSRRRTGATRWGLYRSGEHQDVLLESFVVPSWSEYRRQQTERLTGRDREMRAAVLAYCTGVPAERHYFAANRTAQRPAAHGASADPGEPAGSTSVAQRRR